MNKGARGKDSVQIFQRVTAGNFYAPNLEGLTACPEGMLEKVGNGLRGSECTKTFRGTGT